MTASSDAATARPESALRRGETVFAWSIFPIAFFGSLTLSIALLEGGATVGAATVAGFAFGYALVIAGERLFPFVPSWNRSHRDVPTDAAWALTAIVVGALVRPLSLLVGVWLAARLSTWVGSTVWPDAWPLAAQLALALVVVELFQYWIHRLEHETDWLWRFHATHHSAPRLYWLNAARFHFVDIALLGLSYTIPLVALGAPEPVFALWIVASTVHGICQHANMQIRCGPLNWIFSMAELHRWHHSPLVRESNTNYGQTLILWDIVFGTRFLPEDRRPPEAVGLADLATFPMTWWAQFCSPWRWQRIKTESAARSQGATV
jgi:sterol desaturase/sphingolipid hydroxylase (fatty acid hydroxylase superfamily)